MTTLTVVGVFARAGGVTARARGVCSTRGLRVTRGMCSTAFTCGTVGTVAAVPPLEGAVVAVPDARSAWMYSL
jgi:hypothetical protein